MDFGISMRMRSTLRKQTGMVKAMTVAYAPPERFAAKPQQVAAGDIFSLGVLVYEMITGDVPWMGNGGVSLADRRGRAGASGDVFGAFPQAGGFHDGGSTGRPADAGVAGGGYIAVYAVPDPGLRPGGAPGSGAGRTARGRETQIIDTAGLGAVAGGAGAGIGAAAAGAPVWGRGAGSAHLRFRWRGGSRCW